MNLNTRIKWLSLFLGLVVLAACTAAVNPEWVTTYNYQADTQPDRQTWLNDMAVDSRGNIVVAGTSNRTGKHLNYQDLHFVKFNAHGNQLWAKNLNLVTGDYHSRDISEVLVLDSNDNLYVLVNQHQSIDDHGYEHAHLVSLTANGDVRWRKRIHEGKRLRDLKLHNDKLYVTGAATYVFSLSGEQLLHFEHFDHYARTIAVSDNGEIALGGSQAVSYYNASGDRLWYHEQPDFSWPGGQVMIAMDGSIIATEALEENGAARITRFSAGGQPLWSQRFPPTHSSIGAPGPALVFEDNRGDLFLTMSNPEGHRVVKLDASGRTYWNTTSRKGNIHDAALKGGSLFVVGRSHIAKYDQDGERIAESRVREDGNGGILGSKIAIDRDRIYAGLSAFQNGSIFMHLSQYKNL